MDCLILRFDAPLMSFGTVVVDQHHPIGQFPALSMLTGLLANALGYEHREAERLKSLQARICFAARWDRVAERIVDYQTVDLGQDFMVDTGWTTRGVREDRGSGAATSGTHIRYRHYWAGGCMTVVIGLREPDVRPTLEEIESALGAPARPLFLGRKNCLPAAPLLVRRTCAESLRTALIRAPLVADATTGRILACWPIEEGSDTGEVADVYDERDWRNQMHLGVRRQVHGWIEVDQ